MYSHSEYYFPTCVSMMKRFEQNSQLHSITGMGNGYWPTGYLWHTCTYHTHWRNSNSRHSIQQNTGFGCNNTSHYRSRKRPFSSILSHALAKPAWGGPHVTSHASHRNNVLHNYVIGASDPQIISDVSRGTTKCHLERNMHVSSRAE